MSSIEMRNKILWDTLRRQHEQTLPDQERDYGLSVLYGSREGTMPADFEDEEDTDLPVAGTLEMAHRERQISWSTHDLDEESYYGTLEAPNKKRGCFDLCLGITSLTFTILAFALLCTKAMLSPEAEAIASASAKRSQYLADWMTVNGTRWMTYSKERFVNLHIHAQISSSPLYTISASSPGANLDESCYPIESNSRTNGGYDIGPENETQTLMAGSGLRAGRGLVFPSHASPASDLYERVRRASWEFQHPGHLLHNYPQWQNGGANWVPPLFSSARQSRWLPNFINTEANLNGEGKEAWLNFRVSATMGQRWICLSAERIPTMRKLEGGKSTEVAIEVLTGIALKFTEIEPGKWKSLEISHQRWERPEARWRPDEIEVIVLSDEDPEWSRPDDPVSYELDTLPGVAMRLAFEWDMSKGEQWLLLGELLGWGCVGTLLLGVILGCWWILRRCYVCFSPCCCCCYCCCCPSCLCPSYPPNKVHRKLSEPPIPNICSLKYDPDIKETTLLTHGIGSCTGGLTSSIERECDVPTFRFGK